MIFLKNLTWEAFFTLMVTRSLSRRAGPFFEWKTLRRTGRGRINDRKSDGLAEHSRPRVVEERIHGQCSTPEESGAAVAACAKTNNRGPSFNDRVFQNVRKASSCLHSRHEAKLRRPILPNHPPHQLRPWLGVWSRRSVQSHFGPSGNGHLSASLSSADPHTQFHSFGNAPQACG